ncbi:hypothetical protein [Crossiella sp. NPDC003009]
MGVPRGTKVSIDFGGGGRFVVAVGELDGLISGLTEARDAIEKIDADVKRSREAAIPPSKDPYSPEGIQKIIERTIESGPGTHTTANKAYRDAVQLVIEKLLAAKRQYAGTEGVNRSTVEGKG